MGIFGALTTAVGGLRANSYALENVSGNIANSQTTAFKRVDTSFLDLIPQTSATAQLAGGVTTQSRSTNSVQGDVQTASVATFMAINGNGFFAVQKPGNFTDGTPVFDGVDRYTRRGDFQIDKSGYLVNGAGYYLQGVPIDPTTGNPSGSSPQVLKFQNDFLPAQETTRIDYRANLASYPLTTKHDVSVPGSELIAPGSYSAGHNPLALGTPAAPYTDATVSGTVQSNKATPAVANTLSTLLNGVAPSNSISTNFVATDTITVNGQTITFMTSGAAGNNQINIGDSIGTLLGKIDALTTTGNIVHDQRRLDHAAFRRELQSLDIEFEHRGLGRTRLFWPRDGDARRRRRRRYRPGRRQRHLDVSQRVGGRRCGHDLRRLGRAGEPAVPLGQDRQCYARRRPYRYLEPVYQVNPNATGNQVAWQNVNTNFTFSASRPDDAGGP